MVDQNIGLDIDISLRCNGVYSYKITDPLLFYTNVCGNVESEYTREEIDGQLFLNALQPAFARISSMGIRYSAIPGHTMELSDAMNQILTEKWANLRGLSIVSIGINSITAPEEDEEMIKQLQRTAVMRNPTMAAATIVEAQAESMKSAASNENGAMMGFMGLGMAQQAGGLNAQNPFEIGAKQQGNQAAPKQQTSSSSADSWKCSCGHMATGNFCPECGAKKPTAEWTCSCGTVNKGKFCYNCGAKKPEAASRYRCNKCGWEPDDPTHPPKFCPECGDPFDANDAQSE